jgi:hypothetical protein
MCTYVGVSVSRWLSQGSLFKTNAMLWLIERTEYHRYRSNPSSGWLQHNRCDEFLSWYLSLDINEFTLVSMCIDNWQKSLIRVMCHYTPNDNAMWNGTVRSSLRKCSHTHAYVVFLTLEIVNQYLMKKSEVLEVSWTVKWMQLSWKLMRNTVCMMHSIE